MKQTLNEKIAESFTPLTKNLTEDNESFKNLEEVFKSPDSGNETPTPVAMEKTRRTIENAQPAIEIIQHGGVIYDTALEKTLENMKKILVSSKRLKTMSNVEVDVKNY